jgi:hypothetical protein
MMSKGSRRTLLVLCILSNVSDLHTHILLHIFSGLFFLFRFSSLACRAVHVSQEYDSIHIVIRTSTRDPTDNP